MQRSRYSLWLLGMLAASGDAVRFIVSAPSYEQLSNISCEPELLRLQSLFFPLLGPSRIAQRLRLIPRTILYRCFLLPVCVGQIGKLAVRAVREYGRELERETSLSAVAQMRLVIKSCLRHPGSTPEDFFVYGLHRPENEPYARASAKSRQLKWILRIVHGRPLGPSHPLFTSKLSFKEVCQGAGLPVVPTIAAFLPGEVRWTGAEATLPQEDLFVKPADLGIGIAASRVYFSISSERYLLEQPLPSDFVEVTHPVEPLTEADLIDHLQSFATHLGRQVMLEPRVSAHDDLVKLVGNKTLPTLRVITVRDRAGRVDLVSAFLRSAVRDVPIDNFTAGGVTAHVDRETGRLTRAATKFGGRAVDAHPITGVQISGFKVPVLDDVARICLEAHELFARIEELPVIVCGWDVAITNEGPLLLEGQAPTDLESQKVDRPFWTHPTFCRGVMSHLEPMEGEPLRPSGGAAPAREPNS